MDTIIRRLEEKWDDVKNNFKLLMEVTGYDAGKVVKYYFKLFKNTNRP